ncbi:MAG: MmcQ/YjbR family DNA-binding protein [Alphaproteobacteria bacterium]|nr:MAG: MmcQ/YjbR family DNA-binding protein [Alphaproteobacteria bacterium]
MTPASYNKFCESLPATSYVCQWGGSHVWKVGGKVFAIAGLGPKKEAGQFQVTFKVSPLSYEILKDQPGLRPAPYLASRGMTWIQHHGVSGKDRAGSKAGLSDKELKAYLKASHKIVSLGLSKKKQRELGLNQEA